MSMDRCDGCGFEYDLSSAARAGEAILQHTEVLVAILTQGPADLSTRREPDTWSPLEYCCHVRDLLLVQRERVLAARWMERPSFTPMGREERAHFDGYADQSAADVARQLGDAAGLFANVLSRLSPLDWDRNVIYNYPEPTGRSLRWVAIHTDHEVYHHALDVRRLLA